ncbi:hypothetical protein ACNVED_11940 [Legionella sp. D16C41]|uniref:hypothetical protein n=1 Tax=Legionella sp. D16C41 TaxID=3402688 RepID=UPI003AF55499
MSKAYLILKAFFLVLIAVQANASLPTAQLATIQLVKKPTNAPHFQACVPAVSCHIILDTALETQGFVDVVNTSTVTATNVRANIPFSDVTNNSVCTTILPGATCRLVFGPAIMDHPTTCIPIVGDNTNTIYFELEVLTSALRKLI